MIQEWFEKNYIIYALTGIGALGIVLKVITNLVYIRLVKASSSMTESKNKLIQQMKLKFEMFYKLKIGVNNVDIFVDKYVYKHKFCGLLLSTWENLSGLMLLICLLATPIVSILGLIKDCGESDILSTFFAGVSISAILLIVDNLFNISSKQKIIKLNIKDYLENYLKARLEQEASNPEAFSEYRAEMASSAELSKSSRAIKKEEKRMEKEKREHQKFLELEEKKREKEDKRRLKIERKEQERNRKEEEKRLEEERKQQAIAERTEQKRRAMEEKKEREEQKKIEKQLQIERSREEANEKARKKSEGNKKRTVEKETAAALEEEQSSRNHMVNQQALAAMQLVKTSGEIAAIKEGKKKGNEKQTRIQERNERLKEEIQAQREQRAKDRKEGKDPFETYAGTKKVQSLKDYSNVGDFNMEYEMRVKAVEREESMRLAEELKRQENVSATATIETNKESQVQLKGNSPSEDKIIGDILKEFLA